MSSRRRMPKAILSSVKVWQLPLKGEGQDTSRCAIRAGAVWWLLCSCQSRQTAAPGWPQYPSAQSHRKGWGKGHSKGILKQNKKGRFHLGIRHPEEKVPHPSLEVFKTSLDEALRNQTKSPAQSRRLEQALICIWWLPVLQHRARLNINTSISVRLVMQGAGRKDGKMALHRNDHVD